MSNYIDLDSRYRIFSSFPNPAKYDVLSEQVGKWSRGPRTVNAMSGNPKNKVIEFTQSVRCLNVMLPYLLRTVDDTSYYSADFSRIYLDVHTTILILFPLLHLYQKTQQIQLS